MKLLKLITIVIVVCIACISCTSPLHQDKSTQQYKNKPIPKVGVQLWSVKEELKADFKGTLTQ